MSSLWEIRRLTATGARLVAALAALGGAAKRLAPGAMLGTVAGGGAWIGAMLGPPAVALFCIREPTHL
jgi:hypothetical protein